jgi:hypothetical protein
VELSTKPELKIMPAKEFDVAAPPRYDAYFGMLVISLVATLTGLIFLGLDYSAYPQGKAPTPPKPTTAVVQPQ